MNRSRLFHFVWIVGLASLWIMGATAVLAGNDEEVIDPNDLARPGWYAGASGVFAISAYRDLLGSTGNGGGANVRLGYRSKGNVALEAEFEWIDGFEQDFSGSALRDYSSYLLGLNGKIYTSSATLQPYFLLGANLMTVSTSNSVDGSSDRSSDWGFRMGGGADYYLNPKVALTLEATYVWGVGDVWQRDYVSIGGGVLYRF
ncbi:porin family protein [Myxococcota bacterium]|nr:porin family protein [Myxococcota bacterium]